MTEAEARIMLAKLTLPNGVGSTAPVDRAIQTAKQIGSSWPTGKINLIHIPYDNDNGFWRIIIE